MLNQTRHSSLLSLLVGAPLLGVLWTGFAHAAPDQICAYNPDSGKRNPLGMRTFITALEEDGNTTFTYEQFPSNINAEVPATISQKRFLTLYKTPIDKARELLVADNDLYAVLLGFEAPEGFASLNETLSCRRGDANLANSPTNPSSPTNPIGSAAPRATPSTVAKPSPTATPSPASSPKPSPAPPMAPGKRPTIADLPDGDYRFWNGKPDKPVLSNDDLLKAGGALFLFRKDKDRITGFFGHIDGEAGICLRGIPNGNTVSGFAYPFDQALMETGEEFKPWGPSGFLQVRRPTQANGRRFYGSSILNLNGFNRINLGDRRPPRECL